MYSHLHTLSTLLFITQKISRNLLSLPFLLPQNLIRRAFPLLFFIAMASSSLVLPSLSSKTLIFSKTTNPTSLFFFSPTLSLKTPLKPLSLKFQQTLSSSFVRNVAISSEFDQEEVDSGDEANFSPDLKLFVGNLPFDVDSSELAGLFEKAGNVEMVEVIYDKVTGRSRGFAFVTMSSVQEVQEAQDLFNGYDLHGRLLRVNSGPPPPKDDSFSRGPRGGGGYDSPRGGNFGGSSRSFDSPNRLYVGNLSWGVDDAALENLFSEQGKVVEARVVYDRESGRSRGFGFVTYSSADEVNSAISSLDGVDLNGRSIRVSVAEAKPRRQF